MTVVNFSYQLIGKTPMLKLNKVVPEGAADVFVKLEFLNPGGSVKDRIALNMIEAAEKEGKISPEKTVLVEPTSGNTGIGISMIASAKGYKVLLVMPESMSIERRKIMALYGAQFVLTPASEGMKGAVKKAEELLKENENYYSLQQFENPNNPDIHMKTTAMEILTDMGYKIDAVVSGVGTGGTFTGVSTVLKSVLKNIKTYAVEPEESPVLSGGNAGPHKIQGIGAGFIPKNMNLELADGIEKVSVKDAYDMLRKIGACEGILLGPSSCAAILGAIKVAERLGKGKTVVVIAPDNGERYLSMLDI